MIKPKRLISGDTIGILPSSSSAREWELQAGVNRLRSLGFNVKFSEHCQEKYAHGYLAATDIERVNDVNKMFADETIDAFMCLRGGYGAHRIADKIDWQLLTNRPRLLIGYSDVTLLHLAIAKECNMVSVQGPMLTSEFAKDIDEFTLDLFLKLVMRPEAFGVLPIPAHENVETLVSGMAEGPLIGGNLSLLVAALGTKYDFDTAGKIFVLEDVGEEPYRVDRMLSQLKLAGKFDNVAAIILGDFNNCEVFDKPSLTIHQVAEEIIKPFNKPTIYNFQTGHCMPMISLPFGVAARLDADSCSLSLLEAVAV
ncbi:MAG: LD-carboxypeptidase [Negativicutes bacterium]|jgi:muramoyltetrapeptide carboxypeptidase